MSDLAEPTGTTSKLDDVSVPVVDQRAASRLDTASPGRVAAAVAAMVLFTEVVPFQYAMVSPIIPQIGQSFPAAGDSVSWAVTILGVAGGATMALLGKMGDLWGKKRVLLVAGLVFLLGTVVCALTTSWTLFLVGRGLQATALGMAAISYGLIRDVLPPRWVPIAVGFIATGFGVSGVIAPLIGGALMDHYSWRSIFWFIGIYVLVVFPLFMFLVPESGLRVKQRLDWMGAAAIGVGAAGVLIYISEGTQWGWTDSTSLTFLLVGLAAWVFFVFWESRTENPLINITLLRSPQIAIILAVAFTATALISMSGYVVPFMMQTNGQAVKDQIIAGAAAASGMPANVVAQGIQFRGDLSYTGGFTLLEYALHVGIWVSLAAVISGPIGGIIARKYGARLPLIASALFFSTAVVLLIFFHTTWQEQVVMGIIGGIGMGLYYASSPNLIIDAVPADQQGVSAGMQAVFGGIGAAVAVAMVTAVLTSSPFQTVSTLPNGSTVVTDIPQVYTDQAYTNVFTFLGIAFAVVTVGLAFALRVGRKPSAGGAATPEA